MAAEAIIEFDRVALRFGKLIVHRDISFTVRRGESVTILGPSGAGKTLILKMIMALIEPSAGSVRIFGANPFDMQAHELRRLRSRIGMVFQGAALFDSLSVFDNIAYPLRERGTAEDEIASIVKERLEVVGLPGIGAKRPSELSGGQKKRVGLARALASAPEAVLFDEPTTGLDPTATRLIDELIIKLNTQYGLTAVSVTHDIQSARRISQRWLLINDGRIAADGPPAEICERSREVTEFITGNWRGEICLT